MLLQVAILLVGLALVVFGADWLVDGASSVARKAGISEIVIGLTIVGFGTSCPELVVSLTGAIEGLSDVSVGNVLGSNIFNTLLILGLTALLCPVSITESNRRRDIPITLAVTLMLILCGMSHTLMGIGNADNLTRVEGIVFLLVFACYIYSCFKFDSGSSTDISDESSPEIPTWKSVALILLGLCGLIFGGRLFVDSAVEIARAVGVGEKFIAITVLAGGTSLPELVTCIVAIAKKKDQLALGNILGSNVFNILLILGCSAVVTPLSLEGMNIVDSLTLVASAILVFLWACSGTRNRIDRWEGAVMLLAYAGYMAYLFATI